MIAERTAAGLSALRAAGTALGRPSTVHPDQVDLIHRLAGEDKSHRTIATLTGLTRAVVGRVLRGEIASLAEYQPRPQPDQEFTHDLTLDQERQGRTA